MTTSPQNETPDTFDPKAFRRALGNFATGVTIITAQAPDGRTVGVTASSFNSLSMDPPLILWSSMKDALSCEIFEASSHFAVNILAADQMGMSNHFARQQLDKFADVEWEAGIGGAPILPNTSGRFQCEAYDKLDGGDHWIFVGKVAAFDDFGRPPLCFHQGSYSMVFNHPDGFGTDPQETPKAPAGSRTSNHIFFQMLKAARTYQARYQPKLEGLELNVIEARILLVLNDLSEANTDTLLSHLHTPEGEAPAALATLNEHGFVTENGGVYTLTDAGRAKADKCWKLAEDHATETFSDFSTGEIANFSKMLRHLIDL